MDLMSHESHQGTILQTFELQLGAGHLRQPHSLCRVLPGAPEIPETPTFPRGQSCRHLCCLSMRGNREEEDPFPCSCLPSIGAGWREEARAAAGRELASPKGDVTHRASGACEVMFRRYIQLWVLLYIGCSWAFLQHPENKMPLGPLQFLLLMHWLLNM